MYVKEYTPQKYETYTEPWPNQKMIGFNKKKGKRSKYVVKTFQFNLNFLDAWDEPFIRVSF